MVKVEIQPRRVSSKTRKKFQNSFTHLKKILYFLKKTIHKIFKIFDTALHFARSALGQIRSAIDISFNWVPKGVRFKTIKKVTQFTFSYF